MTKKKIQYVTTRKQCQEQINEINNVCDRCGRKLKPIETVDNSGNPTYWSGCFHGSQNDGNYTWGVKKEIFDLAVKLVCDGETYYSGYKADYGNSRKEKVYWFRMQVAGMCGLLRRGEYLKTNPARQTKKEFLEDKYW